jgi:hypothetical protein
MRLPLSLRVALYALGAVVLASGVLWLAIHERLRTLAAGSMEVHGTAAMVLLVLIGATVALHAAAAWRDGRNRASGALLGTALTALMITGVALYYAGDERLRAMASTMHWTIGLAAMLVAGMHVWLGRRSRPCG